MAKSFLSEFGRAKAMRVMSKAIAEAALENKEAGLTTASYIDGRTVITPGRGAKHIDQDKPYDHPR